jgi:hypothetical protein
VEVVGEAKWWLFVVVVSGCRRRLKWFKWLEVAQVVQVLVVGFPPAPFVVDVVVVSLVIVAFVVVVVVVDVMVVSLVIAAFVIVVVVVVMVVSLDVVMFPRVTALLGTMILHCACCCRGRVARCCDVARCRGCRVGSLLWGQFIAFIFDSLLGLLGLILGLGLGVLPVTLVGRQSDR